MKCWITPELILCSPDVIFPWGQWPTANSQQWPSQFCWPQRGFLSLLLTMQCDTALKLIKLAFLICKACNLVTEGHQTSLTWFLTNSSYLHFQFLFFKHLQNVGGIIAWKTFSRVEVNWLVCSFPVLFLILNTATALTVFQDWHKSHLPWALSNNCLWWLF